MKVFIYLMAFIVTVIVAFQIVPTLLSSGDPLYMVLGLIVIVALVAYLISKVKNEQGS